MRRAFSILLAMLIMGCALPATMAFAVTSSGEGASGIEDLEAGALSDRYESLNKLGSSLTDEESVVIATRIGVLVSANRALNNSDVSFTGEVVGDVLNADEGHKWANLMGTSNAVISVYLTDDQAALIQNVGDFQATGTSLRITGTYHIACPEHEGELDVHALNVEVVDIGGPVVHLATPGRLEGAIALCVCAGILLAAFLVARRILQRRQDP